MQRRGFLQVCAGCAVLGAARADAAAGEMKPRTFSRARLVDERGQALRASTLVTGRPSGTGTPAALRSYLVSSLS